MQIGIKIDETLSEPRIIITTNKITDGNIRIDDVWQKKSPVSLPASKGDSLCWSKKK